MFDIPVPNFAGHASQPVVVGNEACGRRMPVYTELAQSFIPLERTSPLIDIFPIENIWERMVILDRIYQSTGTIFPVVRWCKPDQFTDEETGGQRVRRYFEPIPIRDSFQICWSDLNNTVREGTCNERANPADIIQEKIRLKIRSHNLTWDVYRGMMLLGGISYTDPRTGVALNIAANIPVYNLIDYRTTNGWNGRNEASIFRSLINDNQSGGAAVGIPFTHPDFGFSEFFRRLKRWALVNNKTRLTRCYVHPDMMEIIMMSNEVKLTQGGLIASFSDNANCCPIVVPPGMGGTHNMIGVGANGDSVSIAGIMIQTIDTRYKDPVDGIEKYVMPRNKVIFVGTEDDQGNAMAPGRTQFCVSENSNGTPGLWTRTEMETRIPAAPGMAMQMGNAGLPYLKYPDRVIHIHAAEIADMDSRLGMIGDLGFMPV